MSTFGNWPLLERVTNDQFFQLLPHLSLKQCFLTQVFIPKKKWTHMLDVSFQTLQVKCGVCNKQVRFDEIKNHLIQNDHLMSLHSNVRQFYHPFYTYGKGDMKLARGEHVPQETRENALREVNMQMKTFRKECILAKKFETIVEGRSREMEDDQFMLMTLAKEITNPDDMIVKVCLPFDEISKLLFCVVSDEWQTLIGYKNLTKKTTFHCNVCSINCSGIETLNSHLNGYSHRTMQLTVLALRHEDNPKINKNCCIFFGNLYSFSVREDAKNFGNDKSGSDPGSQITKIPNEIAKKIKALDEYVPKLFTCSKHNTDQSSINNFTERKREVKKFELNDNLGHLGVEYVLKIIKNEHDKNIRFECGLCEFVGDGIKMQRHLLFYEHKKKYLTLHYSGTIKKFESALGHMSFKEFRAAMSEIVDKVATEIEKHHGRSLPYTVSLNDYKARRPDLIAEAYALLHASQNRGPSFSNVFSKDDIQNLKDSATQLAESKSYKSIEHIVFTMAPKEKIYLNQMSHDPVVRLREYNAKMNKTLPPHGSCSISSTQTQMYDSLGRSNSRDKQLHTRNHDQRIRSRSPISGKPRSPIQSHRNIVQSSKILNQNIWDTYRREIAIAANEIEIAYENYRKNPESHPLYEEEWNKFWQRRKKDLEREGFNHRTYNFQPEWVHYFKQRIEVLFGEALHKSQINIRHRLEIPLDAEEDCQRSHEVSKKYGIDHQTKERAIVVEKFNEYKQYKRRSSFDSKGDVPQNKRVFREQIQAKRKTDLGTEKSHTIVTKMSDNHSNVVHVLRLMTAMEEHLGSLGGKVMDLLSNALQLEKSFPGNSFEFEAKVLTISNCQLLETAMEKLKGILFAGLLDEKKSSGFNRVIQHTANLLKYAEKIGWRQENHIPERQIFYDCGSTRALQEHINVSRNSNCDVTQMLGEKALSDTLMDLVNKPQTNKQQMKQISKEQFFGAAVQHSITPVCPPPPNIRGTNINTNLIDDYKGQQPNSGLAAFDTKLSLDQANQTQKFRQNQHQSEFRQIHRNTNSGGNSLYNNSFKNNNDERTNINNRTNNGPSIGGSMNTNNGSAPQFRHSQFIPNVDHTNAMYQTEGGVRINRNKNWSHWNNIN